MINGLLLTRLHLPHPFIATLGTMNVARGLALIITGASPISGFDRAGAPQVLVPGRRLPRPDPGRVLRGAHRLRDLPRPAVEHGAGPAHLCGRRQHPGGAALRHQCRSNAAHRLQPVRPDGRHGRPDAGRSHQLGLPHRGDGLRNWMPSPRSSSAAPVSPAGQARSGARSSAWC